MLVKNCDCHTGNGVDTRKPPSRNRYFYGKMLDAFHLQLEQSYYNRKRHLINRLSIGVGTLCGLEVVPTPEGRSVQVQPGVAIDGVGREVVVTRLTGPVDPMRPTDSCGNPVGKPLLGGGVVTLYLCYHECPTEPAPVLIDECGIQETCEYGVIEERYRLQIRAGLPPTPPGELPPEVCHRLFGYSPKKTLTRLDVARTEFAAGHKAKFLDALNELRLRRGETEILAAAVATKDERRVLLAAERDFWLSAGNRRTLLCHFWGLSCPTTEDACIPLAVIALDERGSVLRIDNCSPRNVIYSNSQLLDLILCLAERVDECCQEPTVKSIEKRAGDGQIGVAGARLGNPLVARVTDGGAAVANEDVVFEALGDSQIGADAGSLGTTFVTKTNAQGDATLPAWKLGSAPGGHATLARIAVGAPNQVIFKATATAAPSLPVVGAIWPPTASRLSRADNSEWFYRFQKERRIDITFDRQMNEGQLGDPDNWLGVFLAVPAVRDKAVVMRLPVVHIPQDIPGVLNAPGVTEVFRIADATVDGTLVHATLGTSIRSVAGAGNAGAAGAAGAAAGPAAPAGAAAVLGDPGFVRVLESGRITSIRREGFFRVLAEPATPVPSSVRIFTLIKADAGNIRDAQAPNQLLDADFSGALLSPQTQQSLWAMNAGQTKDFLPPVIWDALVDTGKSLPSGDGNEGGVFQSWFEIAMGDAG